MRTCVMAFASLALALSCLGQDGMRLDPDRISRGGKRERVKVELSSPVSYKVSVSEVKPAKPAAFEVKDVYPVKESDPVKSKVVAAFAADIAVAAASEVPALLSVALEKATEAQVPYIAAAMYAELVRATVKNCSPVELAKIKTEWYERFHAKGGSKLWWILHMAKICAERGEDVSSLKKAFDETMNKWILED